MQVKLLHNLVEEMAGEGTGRIVEILFGKKDVNEFLISKKMELTINQVRNILYKLSADGLVSFIRKKDKRKGWYIYYWTLKTEKCLVKLEDSLLQKIENFKSILNNRETKRFYSCHPCDIEVGEEKALEYGFTCEECAEVFELSDNTRSIRDAKAKITRTERELDLIKSELLTVREKEAKKRSRLNKKLDKELAEKKALMKEFRAAARKKVADAKRKAEGKPAKKVVRKVLKKKAVKKKFVKKKAVKKKAVKKKFVKKKFVKKKFVKKSGFMGKLRRSVKKIKESV